MPGFWKFRQQGADVMEQMRAELKRKDRTIRDLTATVAERDAALSIADAKVASFDRESLEAAEHARLLQLFEPPTGMRLLTSNELAAYRAALARNGLAVPDNLAATTAVPVDFTLTDGEFVYPQPEPLTPS